MAASEKISKEDADYRRPPPTSSRRCGRCNMFVKPSGCTLVKGTIDAKMTCKFWEPKTAS
jgi:hypothetical protein